MTMKFTLYRALCCRFYFDCFLDDKSGIYHKGHPHTNVNRREPTKAYHNGRRTNEQMNGWTDERMNGWTNERTNGWTDERMNGWTNERMNQPTPLSTFLAFVCQSVRHSVCLPLCARAVSFSYSEPIKKATLLAAVVHVQQTYLKARIQIKAALDVPKKS